MLPRGSVPAQARLALLYLRAGDAARMVGEDMAMSASKCECFVSVSGLQLQNGATFNGEVLRIQKCAHCRAVEQLARDAVKLIAASPVQFHGSMIEFKALLARAERLWGKG